MTVQEHARFVLGLLSAGWSEEEVLDFTRFLQSGDERYRPKAKDEAPQG